MIYILAKLAELKASSVAVIFSFSGHILTNKRRKTSLFKIKRGLLKFEKLITNLKKLKSLNIL
jgi:hypothetical protein